MVGLTQIATALCTYSLVNFGKPSDTAHGVSYYNRFDSCQVNIATNIPKAGETVDFNNDAGILKFNLVDGGDYFQILSKSVPSPGFIEQECNVILKNDKEIVRVKAKGFIKLTENVMKIIRRDPKAKSIEFGDMEMWQPVSFDTGINELKWLNAATVVSQGRLTVKDGKGSGFELKFFIPVN